MRVMICIYAIDILFHLTIAKGPQDLLALKELSPS